MELRVYRPEMPDWAYERAVQEIDRFFDGHDPQCDACGYYLPSYPFHVVESWNFLLCDPCYLASVHGKKRKKRKK